MTAVRFMTCNPGHFHAALVHKLMVPGVDPTVHVYGPLDADTLAHLSRMVGFNARPQTPTAWKVELHADDEPLPRMLRERPGNVVVLSGRNRPKIDALVAAVENGLHVLSDKPWIIRAEDLPKVAHALETARRTGVVVHDLMTERFEATSALQRSLVRDAALFGRMELGTPEEPAIVMDSAHGLRKLVAGVPLRRPVWYFDIEQQGEALADVGTHLVDLVTWMLAPGEEVNHHADIGFVSASRWPTPLTSDDLQAITGVAGLHTLGLDYFCNNRVLYTFRGVHVDLTIRWERELAAGDTHFARFRGSRCAVAIEQPNAPGAKPEVFVEPAHGSDWADLSEELRRWASENQAAFPGLAVETIDARFRIGVPEALRVGHEAHFAEVTAEFLRYVADPTTVPAHEASHLLAKYYVTTHGVALARTGRVPALV